MANPLDFPDIQERLNQIEAFAHEGNVYRVKRLVGELRRALKMHTNVSAAAQAELAECRKEQDRAKKQSADLQGKLKTVVDRFEGSFNAFEKFRKAIRVVEFMRTHEDLPAIMEKIRELFGLKAVSLILEAGEYGEFAPPSVRTVPLADLRTALKALIPDSKRSPSFMGSIATVPEPELFFGPNAFADRKVLLLGSCFIYPLRDKFAPHKLIGVLSFFDPNPDRYTSEKGSEFATHFADILGYTIVDITDRKKADRLREDVERMTRHDLKSPLTAILTLPQLMRRDGDLTERQADMLSLMQHAGYRMLHMINQSLDLYRMEKGVYELTPAAVDVLPILDNIAAELRGVIESRELGIDIAVRGHTRAPDDTFVVRGEEMLLYTMFSNLIKNALEASPEGGRVAIALAEGATLDAAVKNAGAVPAAVRGNFFVKYATAGKKDGTGLGTYGAKLIAETHGAKIRMATSEEHGTTVTVSFPKAAAAKPKAQPARAGRA